MKLNEMKSPAQSVKSPKRIGRGRGSGHGNTAGRGHKGQLARAGGTLSIGFEGGQMPLQRRLPKRGFHNIFRKVYQVVNLSDLERIGKQDILGPEEMVRLGLIRSAEKPVKVLGKGDLHFPLTVRAHAFSSKARQVIEAQGGRVEVL
jgi:large subunit ribosomal protein L15